MTPQSTGGRWEEGEEGGGRREERRKEERKGEKGKLTTASHEKHGLCGYTDPHPGWSPREQRRRDPNTLHRESPPFSQETAITIPSLWLHCMQRTAPSWTPVSVRGREGGREGGKKRMKG